MNINSISAINPNNTNQTNFQKLQAIKYRKGFNPKFDPDFVKIDSAIKNSPAIKNFFKQYDGILKFGVYDNSYTGMITEYGFEFSVQNLAKANNNKVPSKFNQIFDYLFPKDETNLFTISGLRPNLSYKNISEILKEIENIKFEDLKKIAEKVLNK